MGLNEAWTELARKLELDRHLEEHGRLEIEATQIKALAGWEPRLFMKFDSRAQRPSALERATVLPIRNGRYAVVACDGYHDLEESGRVVRFRAGAKARRLLTLPWDSVPSSESQALDMALASGMLADFLGEDDLALTIRGRLRSGAFGFRCRGRHGPIELAVDGVQTEVDAGLEGESIHLVEAKLGGRGDFHVRQLYYPFRLWTARAPSKSVTGVFCCYSDRLFHFWRYRFVPETDYHGIELVKSAAYSLDPEEGAPSIRDALAAVRPGHKLPEAPFPQADNLARVIDLAEAAAAGSASRDELTERYGFTERQARYYASAAQFLALLEPTLELTEAGHRFVRAARHTRHRLLFERLAALPVFRTALEAAVDGDLPTRGAVEEDLARCTGLTGATVRRRAVTVVAWLRWVWRSSAEGESRETLALSFE